MIPLHDVNVPEIFSNWTNFVLGLSTKNLADIFSVFNEKSNKNVRQTNGDCGRHCGKTFGGNLWEVNFINWNLRVRLREDLRAMLREDLRAMLREQVESKLGKDRSPENLGSLDLKL